MNDIKNTLDFFGKYWMLTRNGNRYEFVWSKGINLWSVVAKTPTELFKKLSKEIAKHGFKVKPAKVTKIKKKKRRKQ